MKKEHVYRASNWGGYGGSKDRLLSVSVRSGEKEAVFRRNLICLILGCCSCLIVGLIAHWAMQGALRSSFFSNADFRLKTIEIEVNGTMSKAEVLEWSGLRHGQNLLSINLAEVRRRMLANPYISEVHLERRLPDSLHIQLDERQPVAILYPRSKNGARLLQDVYYVDSSGMVIKPKPGERLRPLPVVTGIDASYVAEGLKLDYPPGLSALNFVRLINLSPLRTELDLTQIDLLVDGSFMVRTRQGGQIRFRADYLEAQLERLTIIIGYARRQKRVIQTVDLSPDKNIPVLF